MIAKQAQQSQCRSFQDARNLVDLLLLNEQTPHNVGAKQKVDGQWRDFTWGEVIERVRKLSEALVTIGVQPGDRVCVFANTSLEWTQADFAIMGAGAITVPIYGSSTPGEIEHILRDSGAKLVFVDDDVPEGKLPGRLARLKALADFNGLARIIAFRVEPSGLDGKVMSLAELEAQGEQALQQHPRGLEERAARIAPDDLSTILYTSGTTGSPKGVMLTHANWTYQSKAIVDLGSLAPDEVALLFLPLAHSFARMAEAAWVGQGFQLAFAEAITKAVDNAAEVKATVMPAVPRVFEKAYIKVLADGAAQPGIKGRLFEWAMKQFDGYVVARDAGRDYDSLQWRLARKLVFTKLQAKLKARFGGRMRLFVSGGAPLARKVAYFFELCGLTIVEGYGLTETSAPTHANRPWRIRVGTVGTALPEVETRIAEDGEILIRGPQVMKGYYNLPRATAEVLEPDGWLHTGDIGELGEDGTLRITDRKKDLIKTSGGKYIAPQELENALKSSDALISQVVVIGDRRQFVSALVTISEENGLSWAKAAKLPVDGHEQLVQRPEVQARVQAAVDSLNATLPQYATVKKFAVLDSDWSQDTGELTPKLSVRRKVVEQRYKGVVDALYAGERLE